MITDPKSRGIFFCKAPGKSSRGNAGGKDQEPDKEALFGVVTPKAKGGSRAEKRLLEDLDAEFGKGVKAPTKRTKPRLAEVGQVGADDFGGAEAEWDETVDSENSEADEVPAKGFWSSSSKSKKTKLGKSSTKSSKKTKKDSK